MKTFGLKSKTFWIILTGCNITAAMISGFAGDFYGILFSLVGMLAGYYMIYSIEKEESN